MSTLAVKQIDHLDGGSNEVSIPSLEQRFVKAWINFDGTTNVIRDSYNVLGITDNGTGNYDINFDNALSDNNYAVVESSNSISNANSKVAIFTRTTTGYTTQTYLNTAATDFPAIMQAVFGN